ncbi:F-box protein At4g00755-like [Quercus lobata]|uniref:F-box domain-containing protein n=1 Tax=Quercus lobata TaxID=97700 RepID=A0A7N2MDP3_QUELO|nr:F-box protein At4g00755-like [Quercus lobata]XP_030932659.1 F-box protein At4g00755-like [Quercus lobata]
MEGGMDFLNCLDLDMSVQILMYLKDPSDLARVSSVSRSWRDFVIANGLFKQLCLRMFPQLSRVARVMELNKCGAKEPVEVGSSYSTEWESLARDHRVYATLARVCTSFLPEDCISKAISASSTDNYPDESIENTLQPADIVPHRPLYWSSKGQKNPAVPETLIYKLKSEFCVITEIKIRPFEAYFQPGSPIYSAKSVRFQMGHPKSPNDLGSHLPGDPLPSADDTFIWTYTSPEYPMAQESCLQKFTLPEPVLCIGGILQIELLGRVQTQEVDGLFYICMSYVQVMGCSLSPALRVEILEPSGTFVLKKDMQGKFHTQPGLPENEAREIPNDRWQRRIRYLQHFVDILQGNANVVIEEYESGEEEDEAEEEYPV